ncbi:RusA family crossover junction endodeoxyribonuclease [Streptomyces scabiei]|uniref:RusA family crossover junction endodeoxyribonuclease n=1 Tax=Streptomyces scabiei TaxID=1930 RepID=UPI0029A90B48|nr:RusA family crossover junction endodeoxyribonuclease [Streptomyces scabiei]MDX3125337.1 RusA family crossover junction endodeoxyribonuclease [Streptomyces scabiei]MDX3204103.1 RusA family crossover junction endodeoxyribonuclease [Streptomyces scabiei]MDX3223166.1 RusA family crossover junction endodeoxyribonuclease [Streptomyces scabiei]
MLEPSDEPAFALTVYGIPGPQGSKKVQGKRRTKTGKLVPKLVESSKKVKPWRDAVHDAAVTQRLLQRGRFVKLDGPLEAAMFFTLPAPQKMPKDRVAATVYPDLSKLLRSTEDSLTTAGVWADDARVIRYRNLSKTYPGLGPYALARPGVYLRIWKVTP